MIYHSVFDISERFPDALVGVIALAGAVAVLVLGIHRSRRGALRRTWWLWLAISAVLWLMFEVHNTGGPLGLLEGGVPAAFAGALGLLAWKDLELPWSEQHHPHFRAIAPVAAAGLMLLTVFEGAQQLSAFDLSRQLAAGQATVTTGTVKDAHGDGGGYECFAVGASKFCYLDGPTSVGFHQAASNAGPIRDGLRVRVNAIGDVIVRLEIADGQ